MDAPILFDGFEDAPELRDALLAYVEVMAPTMTLADARRLSACSLEPFRLNMP
jgi:hypothetical protein